MISNVYQVVRKKLRKITEPYKFLNGDVYLIITPNKIWIWIGSKSYADDKTVGAWGAKVIEEEDKKLELITVEEGDEPPEFLELISFEVVEGDTPGFLKHFEKKEDIDYRLLQIVQDDERNIDIKERPIKKKIFKSKDSFVLDAWDNLYVWLGKKSQVKEKYEAGRITRALDVERKRTPVIYTIEEGEEPEGFWDLVERIASEDPKK